MTNTLYHVLQRLMGSYCAACQQYSTAPLCQSCLQCISQPQYSCRVCGCRLVTASADSRCKTCIQHPPFFDAFYSIGTYQGQLAQLIIAAKLARHAAAVAALRYILHHYLQYDAKTREYFSCHADYTLLAMPTPQSRLMHRGFNLPRWFAYDISQYNSLPLLPSNSVKLPLFVRKQAPLSRQQRQKNRHVYQINHKLTDKILIVDDIFTTGETINGLAKKLRSNGVKSVAVYTISRSQLDD